MSGLSSTAHLFFIHGDPQAGTSGLLQPAVGEVKSPVRGEVFKIAPSIVVNIQALFLNEGVRRAEIQLNARGQCDRTQGTVRRDSHVVTLGHSGNFAGFQNAARVADIWLDDVDGTGSNQSN